MTAPLEDPPEPMVPEDVDLRGYDYMPLRGDMLKRSAFNREASDAEFRAAINLWWASWWELPAGSLPNHELDLARLAGCKSVHKWRAVRALVMGKWVLCSDNRFYHPIISELVLSAWSKSKRQSDRGHAGAKKRWENKAKPDGASNGAAIPNDGASISPSIGTSNSASNANRREGNRSNPPTPHRYVNTEPRAAAHSLAKAAQQIAEQARMREEATPPPGGSPLEFFRTTTGKPAHPREGDDHGREVETLDD